MDLEAQAIRRIHLAAELSAAYYQKPLLLAYSGGKDSEVCLELCRRAHIPLEVIHHLTTADAPETIYHVRKVFRQLELEGIACAFHKPLYRGKPTSMWSLIVQKGWPPPGTAVLLPSSKRERRAAPGGGAGRPGRGESKQEGLRRGGAAGQQSQRGPTL